MLSCIPLTEISMSRRLAAVDEKVRVRLRGGFMEGSIGSRIPLMMM